MEVLAELLVALVAFVIEVTFHALVFLFLLVMAAFSPKYRRKLRDRWHTSNRKRFSIVLGVSLYTIALSFALYVWIPVIGSGNERTESEDGSAFSSIGFSESKADELMKAKEAGELVDVAGEFIKRKLDERKQAEQDGAP